ncbi:MAG: hypothetical protein ACYDH9_20105 [Limisphaerales bacterium]
MTVAAIFSGESAADLEAFVREHKLRLRPFRKVLVTSEGARIIDINRIELVFPAITYEHPLLEPLLRQAGASFDPLTVRQPPPNPKGCREFGCTAQYPWGQDRIL